MRNNRLQWLDTAKGIAILLMVLGQRKRQYKYAFIIILLGYLQRPYTDTQLLYPLTLYTLLLFAYLDVRSNTKKINHDRINNNF